MHYLIIMTFLLSACVATNDYNLLRSDVNDLKRDSIRQERELSKELSTIKTRLFVIEKQGGDLIKPGLVNALRESQERLNTEFSQLQRDLQLIHGRFDENRYYMEKNFKDSKTDMDVLSAQIDAFESQLKDMKSKLSQIESALYAKKIIEPKQIAQPQEVSKLPRKEPEQLVKRDDSKSMYETAYETFQSRQYIEARDLFQKFIKKYPGDSLTDNAYFWIAETYYKEGNYEDAIIAYETMLKKYPKSEKVPGALLKQAFSFSELPDKKTAKVILESLIERFPKSLEADLAKKKIESIR